MSDREMMKSMLVETTDATDKFAQAFAAELMPFFTKKGALKFRLAKEQDWTGRSTEVRQAISSATGKSVSSIAWISLSRLRTLTKDDSWMHGGGFAELDEYFRGEMDSLIMKSVGKELSDFVDGDYPFGIEDALRDSFDYHIGNAIDGDRDLDPTLQVTLFESAMAPIKCMAEALAEGNEEEAEKVRPLLRIVAQGVIVIGHRWNAARVWLAVID